MKKIFTLALLSLVSLAAAAAPPAKKANECTRCADIRKLEQEFLALKYENAADRRAGRAKIVNVLAQLERFHTSSKGQVRKIEFRALVNLVLAATPYDMETEGAESLLSVISSSREMERLYEDAVNASADSCRQQLLRSVIKERACYAENEARGTSERDDDKCISSFVYEDCVGVKIGD